MVGWILSLTAMKQTIASLYNRRSKSVLQAKELELLVSMELRWFDPTDARKFIELSKKMGLLVKNDVGLKPTFDIESMEIPIGFRPSKQILKDLDQDIESLFMQLVNHICLKTGLVENEVIAEINKRQANMQNYVTLEVLAILFAKEKDIDVDSFMQPTMDKILKK